MLEGQTDANNAGDSSNLAQTDANAVDPSNTGNEVAKEEPTMLDAMKAAVDGEDSTASRSEDGNDPSKPPALTGEEGKNQDGKSDPDSEDVPFHDHPRWKEVLQERDGYKGQIAELEAKVEEGAQLQTELDTYLDQTGMDEGGFGELLNLGKLYNTDRAAFVEAIQPIIDEVQGFTGDKLPDDLAQKVEAGTLDIEDAKELARARSEKDFLQQQRDTFAKQRENQDARSVEEQKKQQIEVFRNELRGVHDNWVDYQRKNDPDFAKLEQMILSEARSIKSSGNFQIQKSGDWATVLEQAKANVKTQVSALLGKKVNMNHITPSGSSDPGRSSPEAKTMREAMNQAIHGGA